MKKELPHFVCFTQGRVLDKVGSEGNNENSFDSTSLPGFLKVSLSTFNLSSNRPRVKKKN